MITTEEQKELWRKLRGKPKTKEELNAEFKNTEDKYLA